jgi:hypothetical protein
MTLHCFRIAKLHAVIAAMFATAVNTLATNPARAQQVTGMPGEPTYSLVAGEKGANFYWRVKQDVRSSPYVAVFKIENTSGRRLDVVFKTTFSCAVGTRDETDPGETVTMAPIASSMVSWPVFGKSLFTTAAARLNSQVDANTRVVGSVGSPVAAALLLPPIALFLRFADVQVKNFCR